MDVTLLVGERGCCAGIADFARAAVDRIELAVESLVGLVEAGTTLEERAVIVAVMQGIEERVDEARPRMHLI